MLSRRTWVKCICLCSFVCGVLVPLALVLVTSGYEDLDSNSSPFLVSVRGFEGKTSFSHERKPLDYPESVEESREDLQLQVQEMKQIVVSVRNELRELAKEREEVREAVDKSKSTLAKVRKEVGNAKSSLQENKEKLAKVLREMKRANQYGVEAQVTRSPVVVVNLPVERKGEGDRERDGGVAAGNAAQSRRRESAMDCFEGVCFDYSRCPLTTGFLVYVYNQHFPDAFRLKYPEAVRELVSVLELTHSLASDPNLACVLVVITGPLRDEEDGRRTLHQNLLSLSHWGDGTNHVAVDLSYTNEPLSSAAVKGESLGRAMEAKSLSTGTERQGHDILIPPVTRYGSDDGSSQNPPLLIPAIRQVLVHFEGASSGDGSPNSAHWISSHQLKVLSQAISSNTKDKVVLVGNCSGTRKSAGVEGGKGKRTDPFGEWDLCGTAADRARNLSQATFSLILGSRTGIAGPVTYTRLVEGLRNGAVPVVLGLSRLPFDDVIDWEQAAVFLPPSSLGQLHYVLRSMDADTILKFRKQGRFLWDTYFSSPLSILETVIAVLRQRAGHSPPPAYSYSPTNLVSLPGENRVIVSPEFLYNFTSYTTNIWNSPPGPFFMYPTTPFKPEPVSGSQYTNMNAKQVSSLPLHVVEGGGITGPFFEDYLLGNVPEEQFTAVILTYKRNEVLLDALLRLKDLDHLAKAVVVWNNPETPPPDMKWPDIGVPIDVSPLATNELNLVRLEGVAGGGEVGVAGGEDSSLGLHVSATTVFTVSISILLNVCSSLKVLCYVCM